MGQKPGHTVGNICQSPGCLLSEKIQIAPSLRLPFCLLLFLAPSSLLLSLIKFTTCRSSPRMSSDFSPSCWLTPSFQCPQGGLLTVHPWAKELLRMYGPCSTLQFTCCFFSLLRWVFWTLVPAGFAGPSLGQRVFRTLNLGEAECLGA